MKRIVVITGGAGGIGQACIKEFILSDQVIILDVNEKNVQKCIDKYHVDGYVLDLTDIDSIKDVVGKIIKTYGRIDVLIQTAGIMQTCNALEVTVDDFDKMLKVNVSSMFFVMQEVVKQVMSNTGGVILNFASEAAIRGYNNEMASVHYSASKAAVIAMTRQLAVEWGKYQIRLNTICPGGVMTKAMEALEFKEDCSIIPLNRLSKPQEIANTVYYLCSNHSSMITGQNIIVDGGCSAVGC